MDRGVSHIISFDFRTTKCSISHSDPTHVTSQSMVHAIIDELHSSILYVPILHGRYMAGHDGGLKTEGSDNPSSSDSGRPYMDNEKMIQWFIMKMRL